MNLTISPRIGLALVLLFAAFQSQAAEVSSDEIASTPAFKIFLESYISAVNSKDPTKFQELVHPKCLKAIRKNNPWFELRFEVAPIPAKHRIFVYSIVPGSPLSFAEVATAAVRPTHKIQISWDTPSNPDSSEAGEVCWIVLENGRWYEVIPEKKPGAEFP